MVPWWLQIFFSVSDLEVVKAQCCEKGQSLLKIKQSWHHMTSGIVNLGMKWFSSDELIKISLENVFSAENITPLMM